MDIVEALRKQADSDEAAGTLFSHTVDRLAADMIERLRTYTHHRNDCAAFPASSEEQIARDCSCGLQNLMPKEQK